MNNVLKLLRDKIGIDNVVENEPMSLHTSFKTGGKADIYIIINNINSLKSALNILNDNNINYYIMGNGTNLLVRDKGYRGAIIQIFSGLNRLTVNSDEVTAEAGALLSSIAAYSLENSLTGFEFASGIPGTLGGAVCMNAGAYDGEMKDVLISADVLNQNGEIKTYTAEELKLGYRSSIIANENLIVLSGNIKLRQGESNIIRNRMEELSKTRRQKQPLEMPSAGSTFKRPEGYFVGKLITDSGLKGFSLGGAQVSEKHAGFIVNNNGGTAADILNLIEHCRKTVFDKYGVMLMPEVKVIGE